MKALNRFVNLDPDSVEENFIFYKNSDQNYHLSIHTPNREFPHHPHRTSQG